MRTPKSILKAVFVLNLTFLILLGFSYPYVERGSESYVVAVLTLVPISLSMVMIAVILYVQKRRAKDVPAE